ncbi:hypothetical protein BXT84_11630 [Sulfobacillus thermotolerans]|uniref:Probable 2-phosphosulfolactate phosphatase n=1 Tax=Sulfobacillus thermotolerans TaxID=338644 RepID=A0ABM6RT32_9FIRM|nr:2-phosphosulfolactate phosphatase [Sulfobacillus sp. hq2]AUW94511.1 hypothetical protein BXT84_11630 [Sulfobacillus thermotolerans]
MDVIFRWQDDLPDVSHTAVVVIDTLRATTTIATILANGAQAVLPVGGVEKAFALKEQDPRLVLGGERNNRPLPGFDAGNSPYDYPRAVVEGRRVVLTTTNGTQAVERTAHAPWVALGSLVNARAVAQAQQSAHDLGLIVCAGTEGQVSLEDVLAAGAIVLHWPQEACTDRALIARALFDKWRDHLYEGLKTAQHARAIIAQGLDADVEYAARLDLLPHAVVRNKEGWFVNQ